MQGRLCVIAHLHILLSKMYSLTFDYTQLRIKEHMYNVIQQEIFPTHDIYDRMPSS